MRFTIFIRVSVRACANTRIRINVRVTVRVNISHGIQKRLGLVQCEFGL